MVRIVLLLLATVTGWSLMSDNAEARHRRGRLFGAFGCAGVASCAGEHSVVVARRAPVRRVLRASVAAPVVVVRGAAVIVAEPVRRVRYGNCRNGVCMR